MLKLVPPRLEYVPSYVEALREGFRVGYDGNKSVDEIEAIEKSPEKFLYDYLTTPDTITLPDGQTINPPPQTHFWCIENGAFIGSIHIHHFLLPSMEITGGHIGYGVRPSMQGRGFATEMLRQTLDFCRQELNFGKVLMAVDDQNTPSIKVIEKNGGILENKVQRPNGALTRRYWIIL